MFLWPISSLSQQLNAAKDRKLQIVQVLEVRFIKPEEARTLLKEALELKMHEDESMVPTNGASRGHYTKISELVVGLCEQYRVPIPN